MMDGYGWSLMTGWGWIGMTLMMLVWFGLLALLAYALSRAFWGTSRNVASGAGGDDRALLVLRERFARGELTEDEFRTASATLRETAN
ncbi:MAG TPA: SHOCT domain-containing protein [Nitrolancea sp.]|nr:SHOCT domain-containing protein [Nitrolancea sp.]